jgi:hypothetical protein
MKNCWQILQIEQTQDKKLIKRAYQKLLRVTKPDEKPEEFKVLYEAYQDALAYEIYEEDNFEEPDEQIEVEVKHIHQEDQDLYHQIINSIDNITHEHTNLEVFNDIENWRFLKDINLINNIELISKISSTLFEEIEEFDEIFDEFSLNFDVIYYINSFCDWDKNWEKYNQDSTVFEYLDKLSTYKIDTLIDELNNIKINDNNKLKIYKNIDDMYDYIKANNISDDKLFGYMVGITNVTLGYELNIETKYEIYIKIKNIIYSLEAKNYTRAIRSGYARFIENTSIYLREDKKNKLAFEMLKEHIVLLEYKDNKKIWDVITSALFGVYYQHIIASKYLKKPKSELLNLDKKYIKLFRDTTINNFTEDDKVNYIFYMSAVTNRLMNHYFDKQNYQKALEFIKVFDDTYREFKESLLSNEKTHFHYAMKIYFHSLTSYKLNNKEGTLKSYIKINYYFKNTKNSKVKSYISLINMQMRKIGYISLIPNFIKDIFTTSNIQFEKLERDLFTKLPNELKKLLSSKEKQYKQCKILEDVVEYWSMLVATKNFNVKDIPFAKNEDGSCVYYFDLSDFEEDGDYTIKTYESIL